MTTPSIIVRGSSRKPTAPARYQHDGCQTCRYIGQVDKYDIYICNGHPDIGPSILARYGNDGPEYASSCDFRSETINKIKSETGGLLPDEVILLAAFRLLPSLLLNIWKPANA